MTCKTVSGIEGVEAENPGLETPVPLNVTECGLPDALSVKTKFVDRMPAAEGVKV